MAALRKLNDDLQSHTRSLAALGIDGTQYGVTLTPLLLSRLPQDVRLEWSREGEGHESDLNFLLTFLEKEIQRQETSFVFKKPVHAAVSSTEEKRPKTTPSVAALQVATSSPKPQASQCAMCNKSHSTDRCFRLVQCSGIERRDKIMKAGLCYRCLKKGHIARSCCVTCTKCNGRHHKLLCGVQYNTNSKTSSKQASSADAQSSSETVDTTAVETSPKRTSIPNRIMFVQSTSRVLLQTARSGVLEVSERLPFYLTPGQTGLM